MELISFTVPGPPRSKERPRHLCKGGKSTTYTPSTTKEAEEVVRWAFRSARLTTKVPPLPWEMELGVEITAYMGDRRRRDFDNVAKLILDALNRVAFKDDAQIKEAHVRLRIDRENPRTEVRLFSLEGESWTPTSNSNTHSSLSPSPSSASSSAPSPV